MGRRWQWALVDGAIWVVSAVLAAWLRYEFSPRGVSAVTVTFGINLALLHILVGASIGPYAVGHKRGSFEEVIDVGRTVIVPILGGLVITVLLRPQGLPRSVPLIGGAFALSMMLAVRVVVRSWRARNHAVAPDARRAVVLGAGEGGRQLLRAISADLESHYRPVALLDDDPRKRRLSVEGVKVRGAIKDLPEVARQIDAQIVLLAIPSADAALAREVHRLAGEVDLPVQVLPPVHQFLGARAKASDLRDLDLRDLLGRRPITLDTAAIVEHLSGRRILVTGAGGSIGSELCRQISLFNPEALFMLDRDESGLQTTELSLCGDGLLQNDRLILADIRDRENLVQVMAAARPDVVFHAAALKHLPLLESHPLEAWKSNVLGTLNVLEAATQAGVGTFVNISTDKAADPTCVLGYSKRLAERLTAQFAADHHGRYVSVRFGNVLGSRGSVVHAFTTQIGAGGPVTVTHPDVQRYFMLIPEACQLVLEAGALGEDGEVMVLDMGEPVRILDVAKSLINLSGRRDVEITFTGLRPGEKLDEDLFSRSEDARVTGNPLVSCVSVPEINIGDVTRARFGKPDDARDWMRARARERVNAAG